VTAGLALVLSSIRQSCSVNLLEQRSHRHAQVSTAAEEERLGVDYADLFEQRQRAAVEASVEPLLSPLDGTKQLHFDTEYATGCVPHSYALDSTALHVRPDCVLLS
jgi:hypothetical protein